MVPENENLVETLNQLRQQLSAARQLDPEVAARLRETMADIQQALDQPDASTTAADETEDDGDDEPALTDRLQEAALHFEESHPTIAHTLSRLIDGLGQMGI